MIRHYSLLLIGIMWTYLVWLAPQCTTHQRDEGPVVNIINFEQGSGEPFLLKSDNQIYITWIQSQGYQDSLYLSILKKDTSWTKPKLIITGKDWFVNWADFPRLQSFKGKYQDHLIIAWLVKSDTATFSYDIYYALSHDEGNNWSSPKILHDDGVKAEHGFISMSLVNDSVIFAAWLDGRNAQILNKGHEDHGGEMTLRGAYIDRHGEKLQEYELDARVCDCCQTATAISPKGPIVAYRDRSEKEIRDIGIVFIDPNGLKDSHIFNPDNWTIHGCPVNGPALLAKDESIIYAWYTAPDNLARCYISFSQDEGKTFSAPRRIDQGSPLGRIDLCWINENDGLITWMEKTGETQATLMGQKFSKRGQLGKIEPLTNLLASRRSGFPQAEALDGHVIVVWTDTIGQAPQVKMATFEEKVFN